MEQSIAEAAAMSVKQNGILLGAEVIALDNALQAEQDQSTFESHTASWHSLCCGFFSVKHVLSVAVQVA